MRERIVALGLVAALLATDGTSPFCTSQADEAKPRVAALGADIRIPTAEEVNSYGLSRLVECANGQFVERVPKGSTAENAGIKQGDILLSLDANKLYSGDDLQDFLRVTIPGTKVEVVLKRAGTFKEEKVTLTLGSGPERSGKGIVWQYAGPGQLDSAIASGKKEGKLLLVGLAGADT